MKVLGVDFSSAPSKRKPIVAAECVLRGRKLNLERFHRWFDLDAFDHALSRPGPWVMGIDAPLGQSRKFVQNGASVSSWPDLIEQLCRCERAEFRSILEDYKRDRPFGDKQHRRVCDKKAGSQSPQTLYGTPVALMFFEVTSRLFDAGVHLPMHRAGDRQRIALEVYPGLAARQLIGRNSYKSDQSESQTPIRTAYREELFDALTGKRGSDRFGLDIHASLNVEDDLMGDTLDALICAAQAAWGWRAGYADLCASAVDPIEGWIADPALPLPCQSENADSQGCCCK